MFLTKLKTNTYKVIFSDPSDLSELSFYQPPDELERSHNFDPEQGLEEDEWYYVDLDTDQIESMLSGYFGAATSSGDQNVVTGSDYKDVDAVFLVQGTTILFTKITAKYRVENKRFLSFEGTPSLDNETKAIEFSGIVDAYYDGNGRLYFRNYSRIRTLFNGIEDFFKAATVEEKQAFVGFSLFSAEQLDIGRIGMRASRRIAAILADTSLNLEDAETQAKIRQYANKYEGCGVVCDDNNKLVIATTKDLDGVLNLLSGRYFTSEITGDKMQANSTTRLSGSNEP